MRASSRSATRRSSGSAPTPPGRPPNCAGRAPISGLLLGGLAAGIVGYGASFIIARFRHLALIMITLGMGLLLAEGANSASWLTGGADGLQGVKTWPLLDLFRFDLYGRTAYAYSLVVLFLVFLVARR